MNLACVQCAKPFASDAKFCASCGRPTDADGDGIPDALDELIEKKAKRILAAERQAETDERARKAIADDIATLERLDVTLGDKISQNQKIPRAWVGLFGHTVVYFAIISAMIWGTVGWLAHLAILPLISYTPAGFVVCPMQCETCEGPGRTFAWHFEGSWRSEKGQMGYALVCHNPKVDVDKLVDYDVRSSRNAELQPYMVSSIVSYCIEGLMFAAGMCLYKGVFRLGKRRRKHDAELAELEQKRAAGQARIAQLRGDAPRPEPTSPFR